MSSRAWTDLADRRFITTSVRRLSCAGAARPGHGERLPPNAGIGSTHQLPTWRLRHHGFSPRQAGRDPDAPFALFGGGASPFESGRVGQRSPRSPLPQTAGSGGHAERHIGRRLVRLGARGDAAPEGLHGCAVDSDLDVWVPGQEQAHGIHHVGQIKSGGDPHCHVPVWVGGTSHRTWPSSSSISSARVRANVGGPMYPIRTTSVPTIVDLRVEFPKLRPHPTIRPRAQSPGCFGCASMTGWPTTVSRARYVTAAQWSQR